VNQDLRALLSDLAGFLEQQQQTGGTFYLDEGVPGALTAAAPEAEVAPEAPVAEPATVPAAEQPKPAPPARDAAVEPAPAPAPRPAPIAADDPFARECAVFVRDALTVIARTRQHAVPAAPTPAEAGLFDGPQDAPPPVAEVLPQPEALEALAAEVKTCTACGLHAGRQQAVPGAGNADATLMLVGEAPGQAEDQQGLPFVGPSGKLLTDILKAIGFSRDEVFIGNVLKCRPPNNRDPQPDEVTACKAYLRRQIKIIQPRMILCLGRIAAHTLLDTTASLRSLRESVHFFAGVPVMATYHPAALLRNPAQKRDTWDDVRKLRALHDALCTTDAD